MYGTSDTFTDETRLQIYGNSCDRKTALSRSSASHRRPVKDLSSGRKALALDSTTTVDIDSQTMDDIVVFPEFAHFVTDDPTMTCPLGERLSR